GHEDGFALAQLARQQGCGAILVTGDHRHLERLEASGQRYLLKPFRVQQLVDIVDKILVETAAQCVRRKRGDGSCCAGRAGCPASNPPQSAAAARSSATRPAWPSWRARRKLLSGRPPPGTAGGASRAARARPSCFVRRRGSTLFWSRRSASAKPRRRSPRSS